MKNYIAAIALLCASNFAAAEIAVIVNPNNQNTIEEEDIVRIFLGKEDTFADGNAIEIFYLPTTDSTRESFDKTILKKTAPQLKAYWSQLVFTGKATPPDEIDANAAIAKVSSNVNAIAYINAAAVTPKVKVIAKF